MRFPGRLLVVGALVGGSLAAGVALTTATTASAAVTWSASLVDSVEALPVDVEIRTGYDRALFNHWVDADGDCQNARAEVLIAETLAPVTFTTASNCTVATGQWYSYYDAQTSTLASDFDIDHMVALAEAWDSGAHSWTAAERQAFANDLGDDRSLIAVTDNSNVAKSDSDPAGWLPAYEQCRYIATWVAVKIRWSLTVDSTEKGVLATLAAGCPADTVTVDIARGTGPTPPTTTTTTTVPTTTTTEPPTTTTTVPPTTTTLPPTTTTVPPTTTTLAPVTPLVLSGKSRIVGTAKYADLSWTGTGTRFDLWRGTTKLLSNTTVRTHTNQVSKSTTSATYTVCPAGVSRTSTKCSSLTIRW